MMRKRNALFLLLVTMACLVFVACQKPSQPAFSCQDRLGCIEVSPGEPLKFGVLQTFSGGSRPAGLEQARTVELVVAERGNQLLGHPIQLLVEDEACSAEGGANGALRIVADPQVVGIFGTNCSSAAEMASEIMSNAGLVMISSSNTSPDLTVIGNHLGKKWFPGYFRTSWNDTEMGRAAATFAVEQLGLSKAAVIHAGDSYTRGLTEAFAKVFVALDGEIVTEIAVDENDPNMFPALETVARSGAQMVFFPLSHPQASSRLLQQAQGQSALENLVWIGGEGMLSEVFLREVSSAGIGVYILGPGSPSSLANLQLRERYQERYGEAPPSFYHSFTYDAVNLLFMALEKVAVQDRAGTSWIGRQALREALYGTQDYEGLTGLIGCDKFGDCGVATLNIVQLDTTTVSIDQLRSNVVYTYESSR